MSYAALEAAFRLACTLPKRTVPAIPYERRAHKPQPIERAKALRRQGCTVEEIAALLRVPRSTAHRWAKGITSEVRRRETA